jgi:hypothetical protein
LHARHDFLDLQALLRLRDSHTAIAQWLKWKATRNAAKPARYLVQASLFFRYVE